MDDGFILMKVTRSEIMKFFKLANLQHKYLSFTQSYNIHTREAVFLDKRVLKCQTFQQIRVLEFETFLKPFETFMCLYHSSGHPNGTSKRFIKRKLRNTSDPQNKSTQNNTAYNRKYQNVEFLFYHTKIRYWIKQFLILIIK